MEKKEENESQLNVEKAKLSKLQVKIGELEKTIEDLKIRSKNRIDSIKEMLEKYKLKNKELMEKLKNIKPIEYTKGIIETIKDKFRRKDEAFEAIFCVRMGAHDEYIRGYGNFDGSYLYIHDAKRLDYSTGKAIVMENMGLVAVNEYNLILFYTV